MGKIECGLEQAAQGGTEDACVPTPGVCTAKGFAVLCLFAGWTECWPPAFFQRVFLNWISHCCRLSQLVLVLFSLSLQMYIYKCILYIHLCFSQSPKIQATTSRASCLPRSKNDPEYPVVFFFLSTPPNPISSPSPVCLSLFPQPLQRDGFKTTVQSNAHVQLIQYCEFPVSHFK